MKVTFSVKISCKIAEDNSLCGREPLATLRQETVYPIIFIKDRRKYPTLIINVTE